MCHVRAILDCLRKNGLTARPAKCVWGATELEYLGHTIGHGKVLVMEARFKAVRDFRKPVTKLDMSRSVWRWWETVKNFEVYLHGKQFRVEMDHKALGGLLPQRY